MIIKIKNNKWIFFLNFNQNLIFLKLYYNILKFLNNLIILINLQIIFSILKK